MDLTAASSPSGHMHSSMMSCEEKGLVHFDQNDKSVTAARAKSTFAPSSASVRLSNTTSALGMAPAPVCVARMHNVPCSGGVELIQGNDGAKMIG